MEIPLLLQRAIETGDTGYNGTLERWGDHWIFLYRVAGSVFGTQVIEQRYCLLDHTYKPITEPVTFSTGREFDPRIVRLGDEFRVFSFFHGHLSIHDPSPPNPRMRTLRWEGEGLRVSGPVMLSSVDFPLQPVEKNWVPFVFEDRIHFVYRAEPHEILELDSQGRCRRAYESCQDLGWKWGRISGGTPAVPLDGGDYLTFFHSFLSADRADYLSPRRYFAGAYTFRGEPPFEVTGVTREPLSWAGLGEAWPHQPYHEVVFPSGLVREGDRLTLAYGEHDEFTFVVEMSIDDVLATLS